MTVSRIIMGAAIFLIITGIQGVIHNRSKDKVRMFWVIPSSFAYSALAIVLIMRYLPAITVLIGSFGFENYIILAANTAILLVYLLMKLTQTSVLRRGKKINNLIENVVQQFYEYNDVYDVWFLQKRWVNYRKLLNVLRWGLAFVGGGLAGATALNSGSAISALVFPSAVVLVFNELHYFVNGQTQEEFGHSVLGLDDDSRRGGQYFRLREILEKMLPDPLLSSQTGFELAGKQTPIDFLKALSESDSRPEQLTANYYMSGDRYMDAETDGVHVTLDLMQRNNVVFFNPFYRDLSMYLTLPISYTLMSGKKCLVVTGRMSTKEDVKGWLSETLADYTHLPSLWKVNELNRRGNAGDIGIISFPELYDKDIIASNQHFLKETDLVIMLEPSIILGTGQVALSVLADELGDESKRPVYFVCDRMVDGLVDTLSHVLRTNIVKVYAAPVPRCVYTGMTWNANGDFARQQFFDRQTQYLGNGIELAAIAVKNQIPNVQWYGERKVPLLDIKWIAGQYYPVICQYMNQMPSQSSLYNKISFMPNLWDGEKTKEHFSIVEDEFNNMFSTMRAFLSRGEAQSFVNIFSENYLLRDYMRCNQQMFLSNPNAVPSLVPDYAKTERNTLIKLIMIMERRPLFDHEILEEFHLIGCNDVDAYSLLSRMLRKYTDADDSIISSKTITDKVDELTTKQIAQYTISEENFRKFFGTSLAQAYYILEEEEEEQSYVDARFFNQVTQALLPGQMVTYGGKYYLARHISPQAGVVLRRASDLFDDRKYYRQIRSYHLSGAGHVLSSRRLMDVEITFIQKNIEVTTTGYLEMADPHDLRSARTIDLSNDPTRPYLDRNYKNKTVMQIRLPEADEDMRFTFSLIMMEMLRSVFPEAYPYVAVTSKCLEDVEGMLRNVVYPLSGEVDEDCIYVIEDSDIDLGIVESIDRNFTGLMETITDYLDWHFAKMREPEAEDPKPPSFKYEKEKLVKEKQSIFAKLADRIRKLMGGRKRKEEPIIEDNPDNLDNENPLEDDNQQESIENATVESAEQLQEEEREEKTEEDSIKTREADQPDPEFEETPEVTNEDGTDIFDESGGTGDNEVFELEFRANGLIPLTRTRYQEECFLKFGFDEIDGKLELDGLMRYLRARGWSDKTLTQARTRDVFEKTFIDAEEENKCDFCNKPLSGISYDVISDGRVRCNDCSSSAITTEAEFKDMFFQVLDLMESFYDIKFRVPIGIEMTDARTIAKGVGSVFRPSKEFASRALGYAQHKKGNYRVFMENGSPRLVALDTMVHELTHIWQYINWDAKELEAIYRMPDKRMTNAAILIVHEGMSVWAAVQYMYQIGETRFAMEQEYFNSNRQDIYGIGFNLYREQYPLVKDGALLKILPYKTFPPIDPERVKEVVAKLFSDSE